MLQCLLGCPMLFWYLALSMSIRRSAITLYKECGQAARDSKPRGQESTRRSSGILVERSQLPSTAVWNSAAASSFTRRPPATSACRTTSVFLIVSGQGFAVECLESTAVWSSAAARSFARCPPPPVPGQHEWQAGAATGARTIARPASSHDTLALHVATPARVNQGN